MRRIRWLSLLILIVTLIAAAAPIGLLNAQAARFVRAAPSAQAAGQICVLAFSDLNGDGVYTAPDEPLLSNVTFVLSNETGRLGTYPTDGNSEPYCFGNLAVGQYTVQARPDLKKIKCEPTTPGQWVVPLSAGALYDIAYGVQLGAAPAESSTAAAAAGSSKTPLGRLAAGLLGVALFGAAGYLAYSIVRRARSA